MVQNFFDLYVEVTLALINTFIETQLDKNIRVYENATIVREISQLMIKYLFIWESEASIRIFLEHWMKVLLKSRWKSKIFTIKLKIYPLGNNSYHLIDKTFDKIHR